MKEQSCEDSIKTPDLIHKQCTQNKEWSSLIHAARIRFEIRFKVVVELFPRDADVTAVRVLFGRLRI